MEMDAKKNTIDWAEISTPKLFNRTRPHMPITKTNRQKNNLHNTLYRLQRLEHVYNQLQPENME